MSRQPNRSYLSVAASIVVAGVLISASVVFAFGQATKTVTVAGSSASASSSRVYEVTFRQSGACNPIFYDLPWSITLDGKTIVVPSNATIPAPFFYGTSNASLAAITFSVPNGTYQWKVYPSSGWFVPYSGTIDVEGIDVTVMLQGPASPCTTTATISA